MLLLNFVRMAITLLGLIVTDALRVAYGLDGLALVGVLGIVLFIVFVLSDLAEDGLVRVFNPEDAASG